MKWIPLLLLAACSAPRETWRAPDLTNLEVVRLGGDLGFTEGPVWLSGKNTLVFSDIPASKLMRWTEAGGIEVHRPSENANGNLLDLEGRLLSCQHGARNIVREEADGRITVLVDRFEGKRFNSPNDLALRSDGTLWFTDPPWGLERQSVDKELEGHWVFRRSPTGAVALALTDTLMPNGIALSPDERTLYVADTGGAPFLPDPATRNAPATLSAYAIQADDSLALPPVWRVETRCDGMCIDEFGNVYATGGSVTVWSPEGEFLGEIEVPETPANVCFGGEAGRTLFITARTSLYAVRLDVRGATPVHAR